MDPLPPDPAQRDVRSPEPPAAGAAPDPGAWHLQVLERLAPPSLLADAQGRIVHLSPSAGRWLQPPGGPPTDDLLRSVHPALREDLQEALAQARAERRPVQRVVAVPALHAGDVTLRVEPVDAGGTPLLLVLFDARPAPAAPASADAHALRAAEERLRLLLDHLPGCAVWATDLQRRVTLWGAGAQRLFGWTAQEMLGGSAERLHGDEEAASRAGQDATAALAGRQAGGERLLRRKDGSTLRAGLRWLPLHDAQGWPDGLLCVAQEQGAQAPADRGSAELAQALADARQARQQLEAAEAAKDRFLGVLAHELRNPLAAIASASELLLVAGLPEAARAKAAQVVQRQTQAMKALLDEMLDASRLSVGRLALERQPVDVAQVVEAALEAARPLVQAARHTLSVQLPQRPLLVEGDAHRLAQAVSSLLGNAAKYTPEGGRIALAVQAFQDEVVVSVEDNGIGMDPAEIERLFQLYTRGEAPTGGQGGHGGLGVGLALARSIVEMHGGWIMASSAGAGQGTQLRLGLPLLLQPAEPLVLPDEPPPPQPPSAAPPAEGELVLVVDDSGDAAWTLGKLLELSGLRALLARDGQEALALAQQHQPAVALVDIGMPGLSGHEVAQRLRREPWGRDMVLVAATGWGQQEDVQRSLAAGFDAHLTKPLNVGRVQALVHELLARRRA